MSAGDSVTVAEKRTQTAFLLLECHEAEENLAHVEEKAKRMTQCLDDTKNWFEAQALHSSWNGAVDLDDPRYVEALNIESIKATIAEVRDARKKVLSLRQRKQALGL